MREYATLDLWTKINSDSQKLNRSRNFYLPRHAANMIKIQVIFDNFMKLSTEISLNDVQQVRLIVPDDLLLILIHFRIYCIVLNIEKLDIKKMFQ